MTQIIGNYETTNIVIGNNKILIEVMKLIMTMVLLQA